MARAELIKWRWRFANWLRDREVYVEGTIVLTISQDEAQFLYDILRAVGGSPRYSRRKYEAGISAALEGVDCWAGLNSPEDRDGSIIFRDMYK